MASLVKYGCGQLALLAALGLFAGSPASAADLGGDCCADLEERIAELEATTARKGNRKVKLEVSGQVNEALLFWDDGFESNVGAYTNDNARTRFRFKGEARIDDGWKAGYLLEIGVRSSRSNRFTQEDDNGTDLGLDLRHSVWYVDSKKYGRLWVGLTGGAAEGITEINLAHTKDVAKYSDQEDSGLGLGLRQTNGLFTNGTTSVGSSLSFGRLIRDNRDQPGEGRRSNMIRLDSPTWEGFTLTANYGEDDTWEVGGRYANEFAGFKVAAGIAYGENTDANGGATGFECQAQNGAVGAPDPRETDASCNQIGGSISVMHIESGLYANFAAGRLEDDLIDIPLPGADNVSEFYAFEAGIERKFIDLGKTTFFGQYYVNNGGANARRDFDGSSFSTVNVSNGDRDILGSNLESFGFGVIQELSAASMNLYLTYRHTEVDVRLSGAAAQPEFEDLDVVIGGAIIKF
ncbi:MAG: porin [Hyphomicrobium sp.]|nr:porin [Hyphomicrobium sp.]